MDVRLEQRPFEWHFSSLEEAVEFFTTTGGPFLTFLERAEALGVADAVRDQLAAVFAESASETGGTITLDHPYLLAVGTAP